MEKVLFVVVCTTLFSSSLSFSTSTIVGALRNVNYLGERSVAPLLMVADQTSHAFSTTISENDLRAAAFTKYMTKAHEDKLRIIAEIEEKKKEEIRLLKQEIADLRSQLSEKSTNAVATTTTTLPTNTLVGTAPASGKDFSLMSKEELIQRNQEYVEFMAKYVVSASEQRYRAVKAAEAALNEKWNAKFSALTKDGSIITESAPSTTTRFTTEALKSASPLYIARNVAVAKAGTAGKSRWGPLEVQRANLFSGPSSTTPTSVQQTALVPPPPPTTQSNESNLYKIRNAVVVAAAAVGKSRWGSMEVQKAQGTTDISSIKIQSTASMPTIILKTGIPMDLYSKRNSAVVAAAAAGKSRWGTLEVNKVGGVVEDKPIGNLNDIPPEVFEADHGLRADGGVDGLTLAERVVFGHQASSTQQTVTMSAPSKLNGLTAPASTPSTNLYNQRNSAVVAAAAAGKSRWGTLEVNKVGGVVDDKPIGNLNDIPPEVIEADHGLRADGGVDGLTLAERVVYGHQASSTQHTITMSVPSKLNGLTAPASIPSTNLYNKRNSAVVAAAAAGKSRWGTLEVNKVGGVVEDKPIGNLNDIPPEVIEADHGLRADGGVDGLTLAERVVYGHRASSSQESVTVSVPSKVNGVTIPVSTPMSSNLYTQRNSAVLTGSEKGVSRWGKEEIEKIKLSQGPPSHVHKVVVTEVPVPPEVLAADHGLRADGGVGGLTLAERVAFGHDASSTTGSRSVVVPTNVMSGGTSPGVSSTQSDLYNHRNAAVLAASEVGVSRWGKQELQRIKSTFGQIGSQITNTILPGSSKKVTAPVQVPTPPEVIAADHGLRADGGVGGLSLAERVAFGHETSSLSTISAGTGTIITVNSATNNSLLFEQRNAKILSAAEVGKSRWGSHEVDKIASSSSSTPHTHRMISILHNAATTVNGLATATIG